MKCKAREGSAWLAVVAVAGLTVAAAWWIKKARESGDHVVDDLLDSCEKAVKALDARVGDWAVTAKTA